MNHPPHSVFDVLFWLIFHVFGQKRHKTSRVESKRGSFWGLFCSKYRLINDLQKTPFLTPKQVQNDPKSDFFSLFSYFPGGVPREWDFAGAYARENFQKFIKMGHFWPLNVILTQKPNFAVKIGCRPLQRGVLTPKCHFYAILDPQMSFLLWQWSVI